MKKTVRLLSVFLAVLLLASTAVITSSAEEKSLIYSESFLRLANASIFHIDGVKFTADNIADYITVYKESSKGLVFKAKTTRRGKAKCVFDNYEFPCDYYEFYDYQPSLYVYFQNDDDGKYTISSIKYAVRSGVYTAKELSEIIPDSKHLDEKGYIEMMKNDGINVTWVKNLGGDLFYAGDDRKPEDYSQELKFDNFKLTINKKLSPDSLGLFCLSNNHFSSVLSSINSIEIPFCTIFVDIIRQAEKNGEKFNFTIEHKFGSDAERCAIALNKRNGGNLIAGMNSFGKVGDYYVCATYSYGVECLDYRKRIGNYIFHSYAQNPAYDIGIFLVRFDDDGDETYTLDYASYKKLINDDDIDKIMGITGLSGSGWTAYKLSGLELEFVDKLDNNDSTKTNYDYLAYDFPRLPIIKAELGEVDGYKILDINYNVGTEGLYYFKNKLQRDGTGKTLGIYLYKDGDFISFEQAVDKAIITEDNINSYLTLLRKTDIKITDSDSKPDEPVINNEEKEKPTKDIRQFTPTGIKNRVYTGKPLTQVVKLLNDGKSPEKKYYTVTYENNVNVGTATVIITGQGKYYGTITRTFTIAPKTTKFRNILIRKKGYKIRWKKETRQTSGYEIQYSRKASFKNPKTKVIKKNTTTSVFIKAKTKTAYFRIRTYKTVNGKKYRSLWCVKKVIKENIKIIKPSKKRK